MEPSTRPRTPSTQRTVPLATAFGLLDGDTAYGCDMPLWDDDAVIELLAALPQPSAARLRRHVDAA
ncbi:MAG: hypothetical protein JOZ75_04065 [Candidatus Dormibacteraeota bacterium]|nr:hypothetical protein [Candidatus Dormibacteraeota bacterium]